MTITTDAGGRKKLADGGMETIMMPDEELKTAAEWSWNRFVGLKGKDPYIDRVIDIYTKARQAAQRLLRPEAASCLTATAGSGIGALATGGGRTRHDASDLTTSCRPRAPGLSCTDRPVRITCMDRGRLQREAARVRRPAHVARQDELRQRRFGCWRSRAACAGFGLDGRGR